MGVKYGLLASFDFGGRGEVHFHGNSRHWDLSFLHFPSAQGFFELFFCRGHAEGGSSLHGSKGYTMQKRAGGS